MRSREPFDELSIGFGELKRVKFGRIHPSKLRNIDGSRLTLRDSAVEEMQCHSACRVVMRGGVELVEHFDFDVELFTQFAL